MGICMAPTDIAASLKVHTTCKLGIQIRSGPSLGPRPTLFWFSVCVHSNAWEWKTGEKRGRPGSIHHVSGLKVDVGGGGIFKYICTKNLKVSFLPLKTNSFHHAKVWSQKEW